MLTLYTIFALKNQQSEVGSGSRAMAVEWSFIAFRFVSSSRASSLSSSSSSAPYSFSSPLIFRFPYLFLLFFRVFLSFRSPCRVLPALSSSFSPSSSSSSAPSPFSSWSFGLLVSSLSSSAFSCSWSFSLSLLAYRSPRLLFHFVFLSFLDSSFSSFLLHLPPPPPPTSSWPHLIFQLFFLDLFVFVLSSSPFSSSFLLSSDLLFSCLSFCRFGSQCLSFRFFLRRLIIFCLTLFSF